jgi:hypothetical protein
MELKECVEQLNIKKKELEDKIANILIEFTKETGLTVHTLDPNAIYGLDKTIEIIEYKPKIELIIGD